MSEIERITRAVGRAILDECRWWQRIPYRRIQSALKPNVRVFMSPTEPLPKPNQPSSAWCCQTVRNQFAQISTDEMLLLQQPAISCRKWEIGTYYASAEPSFAASSIWNSLIQQPATATIPQTCMHPLRTKLNMQFLLMSNHFRMSWMMLLRKFHFALNTSHQKQLLLRKHIAKYILLFYWNRTNRQLCELNTIIAYLTSRLDAVIYRHPISSSV